MTPKLTSPAIEFERRYGLPLSQATYEMAVDKYFDYKQRHRESQRRVLKLKALIIDANYDKEYTRRYDEAVCDRSNASNGYHKWMKVARLIDAHLRPALTQEQYDAAKASFDKAYKRRKAA